jgi:hypothetical protein
MATGNRGMVVHPSKEGLKHKHKTRVRGLSKVFYDRAISFVDQSQIVRSIV